MSCPDDFTSFRWHVSYSWRILLGMFIEFLLDTFKISSINMKDMVVFVLELMFKGVSL